jgi:predicted enzyme related to lactoylglutathione lyase
MAGGIVHFEIGVADVERAKGFYGPLLGWSFEAFGGPTNYTMARVGDGSPGGGIYEGTSPNASPIVYFGVDDIDASLAQVGELGGEAGEKKPVAGMGWYAACKDADGNAFSLFQNDESAQ